MPSLKADLAIYTHVLGVPGQYKSVALMLSHKMDFNCYASRDGFLKSSHIYVSVYIKCIYLHVSCILDSVKSTGVMGVCSV